MKRFYHRDNVLLSRGACGIVGTGFLYNACAGELRRVKKKTGDVAFGGFANPKRYGVAGLLTSS
jgi:hypothetical protein